MFGADGHNQVNPGDENSFRGNNSEDEVEISTEEADMVIEAEAELGPTFR